MMDQWWLGTAPSGLELAGEAEGRGRFTSQGVTSYSLRNLALNLVYLQYYYTSMYVCRSTINACRVLSIGTGVHDTILYYSTMQDSVTCMMHASLYYEYGMIAMHHASTLGLLG